MCVRARAGDVGGKENLASMLHQQALGFVRIPLRVECWDLFGTAPVDVSAVSFEGISNN